MNSIQSSGTQCWAWSKCSVLFLAVVALTSNVAAQPDYGPAIWNSAYPGHWYTSGNGHKFVVIHDMEGYYLSTISYFKQSSTSASAHYCINGLKDSGSDAPAGEITQMVREAHYAWHALCWNTHSFGTEHEGFVSNPAWYTYEMYTASAGLQRHLCDTWGIPKDRNHIVGHNEWQNATWVNWVNTQSGWGVDPTCNTHTDPGQYWDWPYFMALINNTPFNKAEMVSIIAPANVDPGATFNATVTFRNTGTTTWTPGTYFLGSQNPQDNTRWGFNRVTLSSSTAPGQTNSTTFTCTAPTSPAIYPFEWKLVQEGVQWFGQTAATAINVGNAQPVADIIVDNPAAVVSGSWSTGTSATDKYGADYRFRSQGTGGNNLQFIPNIITPGDYNVYEWHPQGSNRTVGAPHIVTYNGGSTTVNVNQQINGGRWNLIGSFNLLAGTSGSVKITDGFADAGQVVLADAIKFVYVPGGGTPTPPATPTGLAATAGNGQVALTWNPASGATAYNVKRATTSGGPYTTIISSASASYTDTSVVNDTTYFYVVSATNSAGESANSSEVSATPCATPASPTGLSASGGNAQIIVNWSASSGATSYNVNRATSSGGPYTQIATGVTSTSYTNSGLSAGTTYFYTVAAVNSCGASANSSYIGATTIPAAPTGLSATAGNAQVSLSWTASTGASSYNVKRSTVSGGPYTNIGSPTTPSFTDTTAANGTTYYYVASAVNGSGESSNSSQVSAMPQAPPALHVQSITMSWVQSGSKFKARAVVRVVNASNVPVSGATVTGNFTGSINNSGLSGASNASGDATITSTSSIKTGTVTFTVTNISASGMTYDPAANVVTSATISR